MIDLNKEREALVAQIEEFKKDAMELWFVPDLAKSYKNMDMFIYSIVENNKVFFMREQARQLWSFWNKAKAQAVPVWISVDDHMPESLRNVLVLLDANPAKNQNQMVAHFIPKFTEEYHGDDDWYDYDEDRGCGYVKEGWYANTAYIGDEYSSYFIEEKVTHWKSLKEASESGAEQ
ncbi:MULTISPECIES: DUF551 domain-containing protein [Acinetobacter calcoaceticus/baumannii complex]|uniref:DUF551 domain-containing protein n=1 Tax=Acinetobacter calcoaceticus/baumannii complex TaxID=909768 RepID=UPI00044CC07A|nr:MULTISPECIES: DUF551 domain-containing protein [Acinetobacter calcoaceticus/baumannii complex]EXB16205.1 hypothetical protein J514_0077 [Acinetobacter sp. 1396970]EXS46424.1 hypothetical protein J660_1674 [Acinetobacter sp. 88816]